MENFGIFAVGTVLLLLTHPQTLFAVDIESAKESSCFEIKETVPLDLTWVMSQTTWYYPLMSRLDLYLTGTEMSGKNAKDLREDELYYDYCPTFGVGAGNFVAKGFGGNKKAYAVKPIKGMEVYDFYPEGKPEEGGKCYTTLTDNKVFAVAVCCMGGEQMTWGVMSSKKKLPKDTVKEIYDHAESLGFKREYFTGLRYGHCNKKENKEKNEL